MRGAGVVVPVFGCDFSAKLRVECEVSPERHAKTKQDGKKDNNCQEV